MRRSDHEWAADLVDRFPRSWQARIMGRWTIDRGADDADWGERIGPIYPAANNALRERVDKLSNSARGGISPDAGDAEICVQADITARDFQRRLAQVETIAARGRDAGRGDGTRAVDRLWWYGRAWVVRVQAFYCRHVLRQRGLLDLWPSDLYESKSKIKRAGAIKRMQCPRWWRRVYRKLHARTVEACGIGLGLVSRAAGLYASDEAVLRRGAQNFRNARALESVTAVNDHGQDYTLAELAAKGTANKVIRRGELLTRIAGFEHIAKDCGHVAYMVTLTCPSRFHKMTTRDGRVFDNPKYKGATPNEAQEYLSGQWAKFRAAAARARLPLYGFRIAEPQHDATPHWHVLLFMPAVRERHEWKTPRGVRRVMPRRMSNRLLVSLVRRYFWRNDSAGEAGAKAHRVDFERIDWAKGSAVGYVIKYVSKNIDGHGVGLDLFGNDAIVSSQRVEAWASTWRIRQFQQIGGAPVGVWRELRRLHPDNLGEHAPDTLRDALSAINVGKIEPGIASLAWRKYNAAQGGVLCKRKNMRIKLLKESTGECGTYGEVMADRAVGIVAAGVHRFTDSMQIMVPSAPAHQRASFASVESERAAWLIVPGGRAAAQRAGKLFFEGGSLFELPGSRIPRSGAAASTRIHVNNCTQPARDATGARIVSARQDWRGAWIPDCVQAFAPVVEYRKKLRRFRQWAAASPPASIGDGRGKSPPAVLDLEWVAAFEGEPPAAKPGASMEYSG